MKRRIAKLIAFVLAGTIVNVAAAWGLVAATRVDDMDRVAETRRHFGRLPGPYQHPAITAVYGVQCFNARGVDHVLEEASFYDGSKHLDYSYSSMMIVSPLKRSTELVTVAGWPSRAVAGARWDIDGHKKYEWAFAAPLERADWLEVLTPRRPIPCRPIFPGFAINTIFYAAILWMLFAAPFALRRRRRVKRGLCPRCAYDLRGSVGGSLTCPECGGAVVTSRDRQGAVT